MTARNVLPGRGPDPDTGTAAPVVGRVRWHVDRVSVLGALIVVLAIEAMAAAFTDPDFYLPDPFRVLVLALVGVFVVAGFIPWHWLRRASQVAALACAIAFVVLEARARLNDDPAERVVQVPDRLLRYHYRPGARSGDAVVNAHGLLDLERQIPKPAGVTRVVVLTGSIANDPAIPFEDRFFRRLEGLLEDALPGRTIEVVNVSCEGFNTVQQVRLLEQVGLLYEPDIVVVGFMLTAATIQNGGHRRIGNSYFAFRFLPMAAVAREGSMCALFSPFFERYTYDLIVRNSFERLELLARINGFHAIVAVLPVMERFDDPVCTGIYEQVARTAEESGLAVVPVVERFVGDDYQAFEKPNQPGEMCHPNVAGHHRIAEAIAEGVLPTLRGE